MAYCVSVEDLDRSSAYGTSGCCVSVGGYPSAYGASIRLACSAYLGVDWGLPVTHVQVDAYLRSSRCLLAVKWMPTCSQVDAYLQSSGCLLAVKWMPACSQVDACLQSSGCLLAVK